MDSPFLLVGVLLIFLMAIGLYKLCVGKASCWDTNEDAPISLHDYQRRAAVSESKHPSSETDSRPVDRSRLGV